MAKVRSLLVLAGSLLELQIGFAAGKPKPPADICVNGVPCSVAAAAGIQAKSAAAFVDSIGVDVHFTQPQTAYVTSFPLVKEKLLALGVHHVRDGEIDRQGSFADNDAAALFRELGQSGVRVTFIFNANLSQEFVRGFPARVAPSFEAYEFPNELNASSNANWASTLRDWAPKFQSYIRSDTALGGYPIVGPSLMDLGNNPHSALGDLSAYMDFGNIHAYYSSRHPATEGWGGPATAPCDQWRYGALGYNLCNARRVSGAKPIVVTESGWGSDVTKPDQVPESIQAKYLARMLLLHFDAGIARTFIYQFVDAGTDNFNAYGLLSATVQEKPSFKEIKSLIDLLRDSANVDSPGTLAYSLTGDMSDVRTLLFQKSDGSFRAILWIEKAGFDPFTRLPVPVTSRSINLHLDTTASLKSISVFQDDGSLRTSAPPRSARGDYALTLTDNLTVLEISR